MAECCLVWETSREWIFNYVLYHTESQLSGATVLTATRGLDHHGLVHSAHFFELADQPIQIQFAVMPEQATTLLDYLNSQAIELFYVKTPIEFGFVGLNPSDH